MNQSLIKDDIVVGFNVYNQGNRIQNTRVHRDDLEYYSSFMNQFNVDSIIGEKDKYMMSELVNAGQADLNQQDIEQKHN